MIQTARLLLRRFAEEDYASLHAILSHPEVMRFSLYGPYPPELTRQALARFIARPAEDGIGFLAIEHRAEGRLVGLCGLPTQWLDGRRAVELGYRLSRDCWGQGYALEAGAACRDHAFGSAGLLRLVSIIDPGNDRSVRVSERLGFAFERETVFHGKPVRVFSRCRPSPVAA